MTTDAVVLLDDPPPILNILTALVLRIVEQRLGNIRTFRADTTDQKRRQRIAPFISQVRLWHAQAIRPGLLFPLIIDRRVIELVFEEAFVAIPLLFLPIGMELGRIVTLLRGLRQQRKIQALNRRSAFDR